jgi:hypothetical protein
MKTLYKFLATASIIATIASCKEVGPNIDLGGNSSVIGDTTYVESPIDTVDQRNVLLEEFTGVRCPNCPQGHVIITAIKTQHPERFVAMSIHPKSASSLTAPYTYSVQDLRTDKGEELFVYIGQVGNLPSGTVNRKLFSGQSSLLTAKETWEANVDDELNTSTPVNIDLAKTYNPSNRELTVTVTLHYTAAVNNENKLTLALTESDIITPQLNGAVIDSFYTHNEIFREALTGTSGDALGATAEPGRVYRRIYKKTLDAAWNPDNMHIIAYVHGNTGGNKEVLQVKEIELN